MMKGMYNEVSDVKPQKMVNAMERRESGEGMVDTNGVAWP